MMLMPIKEHNDLKFAVPGGLIGVGTRVDPTLCRADRLGESRPLFLFAYLCGICT